jgi:hypothetical protein
MQILGYFNQNSMIYGSNKVFSLLKLYWLLYLGFYSPFFPPGGKKADPYFRENESSEGSGTAAKARNICAVPVNTHVRVPLGQNTRQSRAILWANCVIVCFNVV